jgi:hypothetical protein
MRVGKLLNKEIIDIPGRKNPYKVERCISKEKQREIEQNLLMKKCQKFFEELNIIKLKYQNQNNYPNSIRSQKNIFSLPKENSRKMGKTIELPSLSISNIKLNSSKNNKNREISRNKENLVIKTDNMIISFSTKKIGNNKNKNKYHERIHRRYNMFDKTLNKLKKPIFTQNVNYNNNIILLTNKNII